MLTTTQLCGFGAGGGAADITHTITTGGKHLDFLGDLHGFNSSGGHYFNLWGAFGAVSPGTFAGAVINAIFTNYFSGAVGAPAQQFVFDLEGNHTGAPPFSTIAIFGAGQAFEASVSRTGALTPAGTYDGTANTTYWEWINPPGVLTWPSDGTLRYVGIT